MACPPGKQPQAQQRLVILELFGSANAVADFRDARVCHLALAGLCPSDLFHNTKFAQEPCGKIHDDSLRATCEAEARAGAPELAQYERELTAVLEGLVASCDRDVARGMRKVEDEDGPALVLRVDTDLLPEVIAVSATLADKEREGLIDEADVLRRTKAVTQARCVRAATAPAPAPPPAAAASVAGAAAAAAMGTGRLHARLRLCTPCGSFLSLVDADERLADHFQGRIHLGWCAIKSKLAALKAKRQGASAAMTSSSRARDRSRSRPRA